MYTITTIQMFVKKTRAMGYDISVFLACPRLKDSSAVAT
jgi:hypothetical protein